MAHQEQNKNYDFIYYAVAVACGMFTGAVIDKGPVWIVVGAVLGVLTAAFYLNILVRGREEV
jgi:membrane associated rhomboid family serine protease